MRQNLALVVGLQGRFAEAETIARADLPPEEAAANVAYLRQMLAQRQRGDPDHDATEAGATDAGRCIRSDQCLTHGGGLLQLPSPGSRPDRE